MLSGLGIVSVLSAWRAFHYRLHRSGATGDESCETGRFLRCRDEQNVNKTGDHYGNKARYNLRHHFTSMNARCQK